MRKELLETIKNEITRKLSSYLREEGIALCIATNDNTLPSEHAAVVLEAIHSTPPYFS